MDHAGKAVAEIPDLIMRGAHRGTPAGLSPQDNIMRFWQIGSGLSNHRDAMEDNSTVEPAQDIEVCHSQSLTLVDIHTPLCVLYPVRVFFPCR